MEQRRVNPKNTVSVRIASTMCRRFLNRQYDEYEGEILVRAKNVQ